MPELTLEALKTGHRTMWAAGDYPSVAAHIDDVPPRELLARLPDLAGLEVLDVATGSGNLALREAAAGARVTGLDLVGDLLAVARERAAGAGLDATWVCADAEALPFADASFDVVTSIFGIQFAPRHKVTAAELVRVLRPGGTLGLVNWTPGGLIGRLFGVMGRHLPAPPSFVSPPPAWGDEAHVRALLGEQVSAISFTRAVNRFAFASLEEYATFFEDNYGPTLVARERLGAEGWASCAADLRALYEELGTTGPDGFTIDSEFVTIVATRT
jgi:ubiquinone/menaquinone biosynthesis C-methylase UbiE